MTRKESDALLKEMRETGIVPQFESDYGTKVVCKIRDRVIRFSGYGGWACRNSFADFYGQVRRYSLIKKLPSNHYEWHL